MTAKTSKTAKHHMSRFNDVTNNSSYKISPGRPLPYGATVIDRGVNFSIFSLHAEACILVLFKNGSKEPYAEIRFPDEYQVGQVWSMIVHDLEWDQIEYGYRMLGPDSPGEGHRFNPDVVLLDPYAMKICGRGEWRERDDNPGVFPYRGCIVTHYDYDWEGDQPLHLPIEDIIIYEMHVRSFTQHETSGVKHPGTYAGMIEKIPYLRELGVNCVELMPIFDFDEYENSRKVEGTDDMLLNYWGYSTVGFFSPKAGFAAAGAHGQEIHELKDLVKALHREGIEVVLDVVFNHTAEGNEHGPTISFRGIDNKTYYMLTPEGYYYNFSGTGNTFNCNHPQVIEFILDCLRYWVIEYHIDGFRFDLASILSRAEDGTPLEDPPVLKAIAHDAVLLHTKIIAEPWDAGGLYHVGAFPAYGRWVEWNGKYRDSLRRFLRGDAGEVGEVAQRIQGSPDLYPGRGPIASVNFITAHDGFTLADMVAYNDKHNEANGEENRDGANDNNSWNCGIEGPTDDPEINRLRRRQMKNAFAMLLVSQGVPMFLMGDEIGRTQNGNNNTYCQDNALNWMDWTLKEKNADIFRFFRHMIAFRWRHPVLRNGWHFRNEDYQKSGTADITWHGIEAWNADFGEDAMYLGFMLAGEYAKGGLEEDRDLYIGMNMFWEDQAVTLPEAPEKKKWHVFVNTGMDSPEDSFEPGKEPVLDDQTTFRMTARSVIILVAK